MSRRPPTPVCSASPSPEVTPGCHRKIHSFGEPLKQLLWSPHLGKPTPLTGKGSSQDPGPGTLLGSQSLVPLAPAARVLVKKVQRGDMKSQRLRIQSPAPSLMAWLTLGKLPALPGPQFSNRKKKDGMDGECRGLDAGKLSAHWLLVLSDCWTTALLSNPPNTCTSAGGRLLLSGQRQGGSRPCPPLGTKEPVFPRAGDPGGNGCAFP